MENLSRVFSPYELNPLGLNPLRDLLAEQVDFGNVNRCPDVRVYVTATNVRTGRPRIFGQGEVTVDSVMASACLPQMYPAVEIDGEAYWDGGFTGNPALYPLVRSRTTPDILVVQINPIVRRELPKSARDIINRVNEISFNSSLIKELRSIALMQRVAAAVDLDLGDYGRTYLHLIHADDRGAGALRLPQAQRRVVLPPLLFERGRDWADAWLAENFDLIGVALDPRSRRGLRGRAPRGGHGRGRAGSLLTAVSAHANNSGRASRAAPPSTRATPAMRARIGPPGTIFWASTAAAIAATQTRFITPPTNSSSMSTEQQPTQ